MSGNQKELIKTIGDREDFLETIVQGKYLRRPYLDKSNMRFLVARRWNSWYPSFFKIDGGCYAIVPRGESGKPKEDSGVIVIDPGFRFLEILKANYDIEPMDIRNVIVTHYHPDHMAGLVEFATIVANSNQECDFYVNETTYQFFNVYQKRNLKVHQLIPHQVIQLFSRKTKSGLTESVFFEAKPAYHSEIGDAKKSLALIVAITVVTDNEEKPYKIGILGDTDGHSEYIQRYADWMWNMDVLVLHLGTFNDKKYGKGDKHLYVEGTKRLLARIKNKIESSNPPNHRKLKPVILSEFGLELGATHQIYEAMYPFSKSGGWRSPAIFTASIAKEGRVIQDSLERILFSQMTYDFLCEYASGSLKRKEVDSMLCLVGWAAVKSDIEAYKQETQPTVKWMKQEIDKKTKRYRNEVYEIKLDKRIEHYRVLLDRANDGQSQKIRKFFQVWLDGIFRNVRRSNRSIRKTLLEFNAKVIEDCIDALSKPMRDKLYPLPYFSTFAYINALGMFDKKDLRIIRYPDYVKFFCTTLLSLLILRGLINERAKIRKKTKSKEKYVFNEIVKFFQKGNKHWAKIIIGDIGCQLKFEDRISLMDYQNQWVSPGRIECTQFEDGIIYYRSGQRPTFEGKIKK